VAPPPKTSMTHSRWSRLRQRSPWFTLTALVALHPVALFVRAALGGNFSDSGLWIGAIIFAVITPIFTAVVTALFAPALVLALRAVAPPRTRAVVWMGVLGAHVIAAIGMADSSNWWLLAYPVAAVTASVVAWGLKPPSIP